MTNAVPLDPNDRRISRRYTLLASVAGSATLFFLMLVALLPNISGQDIRCSSRFPIIAVVAVGLGLAGGAVGGAASAQGKLSIPGLANREPFAVAVGGGIAVVIVVLLVSYPMYVYGCVDCPKPPPREYILTVPPGANLRQTIAAFERTSNINIDASHCTGQQLERAVQDGEIRAPSAKEWLELLSDRVRNGAFDTTEIKDDVKYAISCR